MRQDLIEKLRRGKAALLNNGDFARINHILRKAFPEDPRSLQMSEDIVRKVCEQSGTYAFVRWCDKTWDFVRNDDRDYDFGYLSPDDFFTEKENRYERRNPKRFKAEQCTPGNFET